MENNKGSWKQQRNWVFFLQHENLAKNSFVESPCLDLVDFSLFVLNLIQLKEHVLQLKLDFLCKTEICKCLLVPAIAAQTVNARILERPTGAFTSYLIG